MSREDFGRMRVIGQGFNRQLVAHVVLTKMI